MCVLVLLCAGSNCWLCTQTCRLWTTGSSGSPHQQVSGRLWVFPVSVWSGSWSENWRWNWMMTWWVLDSVHRCCWDVHHHGWRGVCDRLRAGQGGAFRETHTHSVGVVYWLSICNVFMFDRNTLMLSLERQRWRPSGSPEAALFRGWGGNAVHLLSINLLTSLCWCPIDISLISHWYFIDISLISHWYFIDISLISHWYLIDIPFISHSYLICLILFPSLDFTPTGWDSQHQLVQITSKTSWS